MLLRRKLEPLGCEVVEASNASEIFRAIMNESFDLVLSLGYFSCVHNPVARVVLPELIRVARRHIYHLEDGRGADTSLYIKSYSVKAIYQQLGKEATAEPLMANGNVSGLYILKYGK